MAADGALKYPIVSVNDADTKHLFDNRFGTGQSTIDAIMRATNRLLAGRASSYAATACADVAWHRARAGWARTSIVTEVDPTAAIEAVMEGYTVMPIRDAARVGDIFITLTGDTSVVRKEHMDLMKDGAMLANSGHFDVEIDKPGLAELGTGGVRRIREFVDEYTLADGRRTLPAGGGAADQPRRGRGTSRGAVMDMSFANQALAAEWIVQQRGALGGQGVSGAGGDRQGGRAVEAARDGRARSTSSRRSRITTCTRGSRGRKGVFAPMDERISFRAAYERFPATVKGAFVLRGADRDPHQVRIEAARVVELSGGERPPDRSAAGDPGRRAEPRPVRPVRGPHDRPRPGLVPADVRRGRRRGAGAGASRRAVRGRVAPRQRPARHRGRRQGGRAGSGKLRIEHVECGGDSIKVSYTADEPATIKLTADGRPSR